MLLCQEAILAPPKDANDPARRLIELPALRSQDRDVRPAIVIQIDNGHGLRGVDG